MWLAAAVACFVLLVCLGQASADWQFNPEFERDSLSLNGEWLCHTEHGDKEVWKAEVAQTLPGWKKVAVPGNLLLGVHRKQYAKVRNVWAARTFSLTRGQASKGAVLKWNSIRFGAKVWINGTFLTTHEPIGPATVMIPPGVLRAGRNLLTLKITGWAGVPRGKEGYPLIPTGSSTQPWGIKNACIDDDIWLDFYDRVYVKWVLAVPDIKAGAVTFRVHLDSATDLPARIDLSARVQARGSRAISGRGKVAGEPAKAYSELTVPIRNIKLWTPAEPNLYVAEIDARTGNRVRDRVRFHFGMREIRVRKGHFRLNGRPLWLRGSNVVCEWRWMNHLGDSNRRVRDYLVEQAQAMSLNSFRTHTLPPPKLWADTGDQYGTMFLAEFPVLYNNRDFKFTDSEREIFHKHATLDATGWVTKLWNHPSVIIWVLSNESRFDNEWESGPFAKHVRALDPTRPTLRSDGPGGTPQTYDIHTTNNYVDETEGAVFKTLARKMSEKDPKRSLSNTEYMNLFGGYRETITHWMGRYDHPDGRLNFAEFGAEHTEVMRRLGYDGIFPYMYAPWTGPRRGRRRWRPDFPTPMAAALHSAMSPVLASLDLFDRNFDAGREVETPLAMINETQLDVPAKVDVYVTPAHPLFVPDAKALAAAVWRGSFEYTFKADTIATHKLRWQVPAKEGNYHLAVVVTRKSAKPVVSQRVVRAIDPQISREGLTGRPVVVLGASAAAEKWLKARNIPYRTAIAGGAPAGSVVVIWNAAAISDAQRAAAAPRIRKHVRGGGRLVILRQGGWDWTKLLDFGMDAGKLTASSRAFPYSRARHPMLSGIDPEFLKRWNGLPGTVADRVLTGEALKDAKKLLWINKNTKPVAVSVPLGSGEMVVCTLLLASHLRGRTYDPVAERIMLNLLGR